jgi:hypothetical protein
VFGSRVVSLLRKYADQVEPAGEPESECRFQNRERSIARPTRQGVPGLTYFFGVFLGPFCDWRRTSPAKLRVTLLPECIALPASLFTRFDPFAVSFFLCFKHKQPKLFYLSLLSNMVILNADDGKIITTLPIGIGTDGAPFNPSTLEAFSSLGLDGTLTIVKENSPSDFVVEQTLPTMNGARTSGLDIKTNHVILIAAEFNPPTLQAQPGGRPGRGQIVADSFSILVVGK